MVASPPPRCSSAAARSTARPLTAGGRSMSASRSRRLVSRLSAPAPRTSLLRTNVTSAIAASTTSAPTAMVMMAAELMTTGASQFEEDAVTPWQREVEARATEERADEDQHRPEHQVHGHQ